MNDEILEGYTRISDISAAFANYGKVPKNILDYAADRGSRVHYIISDLLNDIVVKEERYTFCGKSLRPYIESFEKFWKPYEGSEILIQEERLYHERMMVTGTPDLLANMDGKIVLIDWKCTRDIGKHWIIQASGYEELLIENKYGSMIDKIIFVKLDKDGAYPIITEYEPNPDLFMNAYEFYKMFFMDQTHNLEMD
jgi:hypothetical protein